MEKQPELSQEKNINSAELTEVINNLLEESLTYDVDYLDFRDKIVEIVLNWFDENKTELEKDFEDFYPQTHPAKQKLLEAIQSILPPDRIKITGSQPKFRQTKIVDHWVGEIYHKILKYVFKGKS